MRQLRPADATGTEGISEVLMTPDGKGYTYGGVRRLSNLFVITGMKAVFSSAQPPSFLCALVVLCG